MVRRCLRRSCSCYFSAIAFITISLLLCTLPFRNFHDAAVKFAFFCDHTIQDIRIFLITIFPINYEYMETENDISSDMEYDKALMFRFAAENNIADSHLQQQKMFYSDTSQKERTAIMEQERDVQWLALYYIPQLSCPTKIRLGSVGENGYTMCNPWVLASMTHPCIVYSFGVNNLVVFETSLYKISGNKCKIYCFDEDYERPELLRAFNGTFFKATVSHESVPEKQQYSILDITRKFGHNERIDVLKVDIEGAEFHSLGAFLRKYNGQICQIVMELHANSNKDTKIWLRFFRMMERRGFRLYDREVNSYTTIVRPWAWQYSYIHLSCFEEFGLSQDSVIFRYFE